MSVIDVIARDVATIIVKRSFPEGGGLYEVDTGKLRGTIINALTATMEQQKRIAVSSTLHKERIRQIKFLKRLCWSMYDIWGALTAGVDVSEHEEIQKLIENTI